MPVLDPKVTEEQVAKLWLDYFNNRTQDLRNQLIEAYLPLVEVIAAKLHSTLPRSVDRDDLVLAGVFGLTESIRRYSPDRGVKFQNFAHFRIRGAMVDELRSQDWLPRNARTAIKSFREARDHFLAEYHREPSNEELANLLGVGVEEVRELALSSQDSTIQTLETPVISSEGEEVRSVSETLVSDLDVFGEVNLKLTLENLKESIASAIRGLKPREQLTVYLYYAQGLTLSQVGQIVGVSESRVCQVQTKALEGIRDFLHPSDLPPTT